MSPLTSMTFRFRVINQFKKGELRKILEKEQPKCRIYSAPGAMRKNVVLSHFAEHYLWQRFSNIEAT